MAGEEKKMTFKCKNCEKTIETDGEVPECCDAPMEKMEDLASCQMSATAEHARADEMLEPCDDGRSGKL